MRDCAKPSTLLAVVLLVSLNILLLVLPSTSHHHTQARVAAALISLPSAPADVNVNCSLHDADLLPHTLPRGVGLASYPGSGNTFVRSLLEMATGVHTGSLYRDPILVKMGFEGEGHINNVSVVKSHEPFGAARLSTHNITKVIHIIREPFGAVKSLFAVFSTNFCHNCPGKLDKWTEFTSDGGGWSVRLDQWVRDVDYWMEKAQSNEWEVLPLFFHDIVQNPSREIEKMLDFVEMTVDKRRLACMADKSNWLNSIRRRPQPELRWPLNVAQQVVNRTQPYFDRWRLHRFHPIFKEQVVEQCNHTGVDVHE